MNVRTKERKNQRRSNPQEPPLAVAAATATTAQEHELLVGLSQRRRTASDN